MGADRGVRRQDGRGGPATSPWPRSADHAGRRGLAGTILVHKIAGAAAEAGALLEQVCRRGQGRRRGEVGTMGVALTPVHRPGRGPTELLAR